MGDSAGSMSICGNAQKKCCHDFSSFPRNFTNSYLKLLDFVLIRFVSERLFEWCAIFIQIPCFGDQPRAQNFSAWFWSSRRKWRNYLKWVAIYRWPEALPLTIIRVTRWVGYRGGGARRWLVGCSWDYASAQSTHRDYNIPKRRREIEGLLWNLWKEQTFP